MGNLAVHAMLCVTRKTDVYVVIFRENNGFKQGYYFVEDGFGVQGISFFT